MNENLNPLLPVSYVSGELKVKKVVQQPVFHSSQMLAMEWLSSAYGTVVLRLEVALGKQAGNEGGREEGKRGCRQRSGTGKAGAAGGIGSDGVEGHAFTRTPNAPSRPADKAASVRCHYDDSTGCVGVGEEPSSLAEMATKSSNCASNTPPAPPLSARCAVAHSHWL